MKTYTFNYTDDDSAMLKTYCVEAIGYSDAVESLLTAYPNTYYYEERSDD